LSWLDRPRYQAHTGWNSPLLLAFAAPRRNLPALAADVTMETYYYGHKLHSWTPQ